MNIREKNERDESRLKVSKDRMEERAPSPIPLSPPSSPMSERREARISDLNKESEKEPTSSPINIPCSKAKHMITPGLEVTSLTSLSHVPTSKFIVGRSHYSSQPITIEYYVTERMIEGGKEASGSAQKIIKQATTIRSIGDYQIIRTIGSGSTGKVKLGVNIRTQKKVAIKIISKKYINDPGKKSKETPESRKRRILREAAILNLAHHPNIVKLHDLYVTEEYYCMVFEYVDGGQMLDYIISHGKLKELQAQKFFLQLLSAVSYCHENGIVHRDLKIENVLIDSQGDVKLVDFGLSNFYDPSDKLKTFCGSLYFAAPELLRGILYTGPEIDVWSLGIILYVLVCGKVPFDDKSLTALHEKIKSGQFVLPTNLSNECQNLLKSMIEVDPKKRARIDEISNHPWTRLEGHTVAKFHLGRDQLSLVNPDIEMFLIREFCYQYEEDEIKRILRATCSNWSQYCNNPIVALYFLASQKQERQLTDPFSSSPQIPIRDSIEKEKEKEKVVIVDTFVPHSFDSTMRKRSDSMPCGSVLPDENNNNRKVMKSKRSSSLQCPPPSSLKVFEHQKPSVSLPPINEIGDSPNEVKVRTVYLRGIFSVNTTSMKSPTEIREIIMKCLIERHSRIIFLDRESYFICEFQSSVLSRSVMNEDDAEEAHSIDDVDISQIDLAEGKDEDKAAAELTFGAAPLRSIRFEIHIVRVALLGLNGIQFKRISGDFEVYKNLCSQLISEFKL